MLSLRNRFGIPGVISVIALVFAMFGGAYAASNSSGGGKATASAKAKKGPRGPKGATGPAGPAGAVGPAGAAGAKGETGAAGANGTNGAAGANGKTVLSGTATPTAAVGTDGDFYIETDVSKIYGPKAAGAWPAGVDLKGKEGSPWTAEGTLPEEATETGTWSVVAPRKEATTSLRLFASISFSIPLENGLDESHVHFINAETPPSPPCPGTVLEPAAESGHLCVYAGYGGLILLPGEGILAPDYLAIGTGTGGAILQFEPSEAEPRFGFGSWAVTG